MPLNTPAGRPLFIGAYVMFGPSSAPGASVVGKLWDCCICHDQVPNVTLLGQRFIAISSQPSNAGSQASTLLMCAPPAQIHKSGSVSTADGPPGHASVFWGGGDDFSWANPGDPITINGIPNQVQSITSNLAIIVANPIRPPLIGVPYTTP